MIRPFLDWVMGFIGLFVVLFCFVSFSNELSFSYVFVSHHENETKLPLLLIVSPDNRSLSSPVEVENCTLGNRRNQRGCSPKWSTSDLSLYKHLCRTV